jgi:hypothetical protein
MTGLLETAPSVASRPTPRCVIPFPGGTPCHAVPASPLGICRGHLAEAAAEHARLTPALPIPGIHPIRRVVQAVRATGPYPRGVRRMTINTKDDSVIETTPPAVYTSFGRCRSGKRWFWFAHGYTYDYSGDAPHCDDPACAPGLTGHEYGWDDDEETALAAMLAAAGRIGGTQLFRNRTGNGRASHAADAPGRNRGRRAEAPQRRPRRGRASRHPEGP